MDRQYSQTLSFLISQSYGMKDSSSVGQSVAHRALITTIRNEKLSDWEGYMDGPSGGDNLSEHSATFLGATT